MNEQEAIKFIEQNKWTFAKTMAKIPHEWLFRGKSTSESLFYAFVEYIRANGYEAWHRFSTKLFSRYELSGFHKIR